MSESDELRATAERIARDLADRGLIVDSGWVMFRLLTLDPHMPPSEVDRCREAFFTGALHMFGELMSEKARMPRLENIADELEKFQNTLRLKYGRPTGSA